MQSHTINVKRRVMLCILPTKNIKYTMHINPCYVIKLDSNYQAYLTSY